MFVHTIDVVELTLKQLHLFLTTRQTTRLVVFYEVGLSYLGFSVRLAVFG